MHDTRNFLLVIVLVGSVLWTFAAWFILGPDAAWLWPQRVIALVLVAASAAWLLYAFTVEDKLPNHLKQALGGGIYYEADGISFMPTIRPRGKQAELSVYYQNRYENPAQVIVHLRPPRDSFVIRPGIRDVHFAFKADGGDYGVIHQPIAVPDHLQGEVLNVQVAAASYYPRAKGSRLRREAGVPCGTLLVDWGGAAFKTGVHEVSGELELISPATMHLSLPVDVRSDVTGAVWKQQRLAAGVEA